MNQEMNPNKVLFVPDQYAEELHRRLRDSG